uniref:Galectin domain-containing protein n=1 Tax=Meloidogyne floridensis TaxID=298350 RepID=A0A915NNQ1_9BILA
MCEIKRKEYCNSGKGIDSLCSYNIGSEEQFSITIGEKEFTTRLIVIENEGLAMNKYSVDVEHKRKFFEEIKWAPFNVSRLFSAHSTFWMLGYDILSKEMDNILSFYVDRGCNCPMKVWFTREEKISRKSKEMLNKWFEVTEFGNSKCPKTKTEEAYNLIGNIEIEINFKIFINNLNATATFKLYNNERSIGMYDVNGDWSQSKIDILPNKNIMREGMTLNIKIKLFKFHCEFNIGNETKTFINKFWYNKWWNGKKYLTYKKLEVFGDFIRVNAITEIENEKLQLKETEKIYKYELDQLPFIGSTFCLEGTLPKSTDVEGIEKLVISLMHESNDESKRFGDTLLKMDFSFSSDHEKSWLKITSKLFGQDETNEKKYANPIGLSGVDLTVRIAIEESYFKIGFNEGKAFIKYNYVAPPWMVNWIMVKGNIDNVKFGNDAKGCPQYISKPLPPHITKIENLKEGQYISVKGKVTKFGENILINFYYGALGWDEKIKPLKPKLEIGQIINMVFLATKTNFEIYYDDQEIYQFELPLWAIQYVEVTGPISNIEGRDRIAEIRK